MPRTRQTARRSFHAGHNHEITRRRNIESAERLRTDAHLTRAQQRQALASGGPVYARLTRQNMNHVRHLALRMALDLARLTAARDSLMNFFEAIPDDEIGPFRVCAESLTEVAHACMTGIRAGGHARTDFTEAFQIINGALAPTPFFFRNEEDNEQEEGGGEGEGAEAPVA